MSNKAIQFVDASKNNIYPHPYFPVGSIYLSVVNTNPTKWFGGTWEQIAQGRTLVGVDANQTEFNTVKKTGGEKNVTLDIRHIPAHQHRVGSFFRGANANSTLEGKVTPNVKVDGVSTSVMSDSVGGGEAHNNLPPYFTCYIWCRTA